MSDRKLGYILIILLIFFSLVVTSYFTWISFLPVEIRTVSFDQVGSLSIQDPVRFQGSMVGFVRNMKIVEVPDSQNTINDQKQKATKYKVYVEIESPKPIPIRTSSKVELVVKGIMGERYIEISPGNETDPIVNKSSIIEGKFILGPSEALAYLDLLESTLLKIKDVIVLMHKGSQTQASFVFQFEEVTNSLDSIAGTLQSVFLELDRGLAPGLDSASALLEKTIDFTSSVSSTLPQLTASVDTLLLKTGKLIPQVEKFVNEAQKVTESLGEDNKLLWGDNLEKIQLQLKSVREAVETIRHDGLELPVKAKFF